MKVVHELGLAGYVETVHGRGGGLRRVVKQALEAFFRTLDGYTLADLVAPRQKRLERLFAS
jgi:DNA-binding IscR family transcriptional regulator